MSFKPGRNDPCPCGSGKKFKHCHGRPEGGPVDAEAHDEALARAVRWLDARHHKAFHEAMGELLAAVLPPPEDVDDDGFDGLDEETAQSLFAHLTEFHVAQGEIETKRGPRPAHEVLLAEDGCPFSPGQRRYIEALVAHPMRLYTVTDVQRGQGLTLVDALDHDAAPQTVQEREGSRQLKPGMTLGARIIPIKDHLELSGAVYPFSAMHAPLAVEAVRTEIETERSAGAEPAEVAWAATMRLIEVWVTQWTQPSPTPRIVDASSGEAMLLITDHYALNDAPALAARLARQADVKGDAGHGWSRLVRGSDGLDRPVVSINPGRRPERLSVFYRTQTAADEGRPWFEATAGDAVRHLTREIVDPGAAVARGAGKDADTEASRAGGAGAGPGVDLTDAETAELMHKVLHRHYENWADEPVPMLGNLTPRQCMTTPTGLERVKGLLRYYESGEAEQAQAQGREPFSFDFLWQDLGIER